MRYFEKSLKGRDFFGNFWECFSRNRKKNPFQKPSIKLIFLIFNKFYLFMIYKTPSQKKSKHPIIPYKLCTAICFYILLCTVFLFLINFSNSSILSFSSTFY